MEGIERLIFSVYEVCGTGSDIPYIRKKRVPLL